MGSQGQINRLGERFSSHTQAQPRRRRTRGLRDAEAARDRLIEATAEMLAERGDPRLVWSRVFS
jgi:hypothetical protein